VGGKFSGGGEGLDVWGGEELGEEVGGRGGCCAGDEVGSRERGGGGFVEGKEGLGNIVRSFKIEIIGRSQTSKAFRALICSILKITGELGACSFLSKCGGS